ncbi:MAG: hypothetical protein KZQ99_12610 [Candidatus Thiodiazotropha sp. (ex Dulcina madagascariensis)]|nr:hypothetical protein [Candidatus Thiodiazotropha sp. (ex Dulcina madagascariensis)]
MGKKKRGSKNEVFIRPGSAKPHGELVNSSVHVFVDDQVKPVKQDIQPN